MYPGAAGPPPGNGPYPQYMPVAGAGGAPFHPGKQMYPPGMVGMPPPGRQMPGPGETGPAGMYQLPQPGGLGPNGVPLYSSHPGARTQLPPNAGPPGRPR